RARCPPVYESDCKVNLYGAWRRSGVKYGHLQSTTSRMHKPKLVATVGPACNSYEALLDLVQKGVNVFRLNFSHGTHDEHRLVIEHIKKINDDFPFNIAILADLQGPNLRVGNVKDGPVDLMKGKDLVFSPHATQATAEEL